MTAAFRLTATGIIIRTSNGSASRTIQKIAIGRSLLLGLRPAVSQMADAFAVIGIAIEHARESAKGAITAAGDEATARVADSVTWPA